jgi:hypothetical protein
LGLWGNVSVSTYVGRSSERLKNKHGRCLWYHQLDASGMESVMAGEVLFVLESTELDLTWTVTGLSLHVPNRQEHIACCAVLRIRPELVVV